MWSRSWRRRLLWGGGMLLGAVAASGRLSEWSQQVEATSAAYAALFKSVPMPGGAVIVRRAPVESRAALTSLINGSTANAELWAMRAREAEAALDFASAEKDWVQFAARASSKVEGLAALAEYYERRNQLALAVDRLLEAGAVPVEAAERLKSSEKQRAWTLLHRAQQLSHDGLLGDAADRRVLEALVQRFPGDASGHRAWFSFLVEHGDAAGARGALERYRRQFPEDAVYPVQAEATVESQAGRFDAAVAVYERAYRPTWPAELVDSWLRLLDERQRLRAFREQVRARAIANPRDFVAASQLFHIWNYSHDPVQAALSVERWRQSFEASAGTFEPRQLLDGAELLSRVNRHEDAARFLQTAYVVSAKPSAAAEEALAGLTELLLDHPEHPIALGQANFDFYRDVAAMDRGPGFLNGILSLVLNGQPLGAQLVEQEQGAVSYWHRSMAARLLDELGSRYPQSMRRQTLEAKLIEAYNVYGASQGVVQRGAAFLAAYPQAKERRQVSLAMADAYARLGQVKEELGLYERLLGELSREAAGVPVGDESMWASVDGAPKARSSPYVEVLDRYIARLITLQRTGDALAAYRKELDRNPNDPGLYLRLAEFLQENRRTTDAEQVYQRARRQFNDTSWTDRLARWFLATKQTAKMQALTSEVLVAFSGSALEKYLNQVNASGELGAQYALQIYLAAMQRFPRNVAIIKRVVAAYESKPTANAAQRLKLLRETWTLDGELKNAYLQELSSQKRLDGELAAARKLLVGDPVEASVANPAAAAMVSSAEIWRSHYESAAPWMLARAKASPGEEEQVLETASLLRSLAWSEPGRTAESADLLRRLAEANPAEARHWTSIGETLADREQFGEAAKAWAKIASARPGDAARYVEAATVLWDYYQFGEARAQLDLARTKLRQPALFGYEYGAVLESEGKTAEAIGQYVRSATGAGSLSEGGGDSTAASERLLWLAKRPQSAGLVDQATRAAGSEAAVALRLRVLEATNRRREAEQELIAVVNASTDSAMFSYAQQHAAEAGFAAAAEAVVSRRVTAATDAVERIRLRIEQAKFYEDRNQTQRAQELLAACWREQPNVLGVMRALADFYWRQQQTGRALDVLDQAAARAYPALRESLLSELAAKAQERGQFARVRQALGPLLKAQPLRVEWQQLYGESLRKEGRDGEWRQHMLASIEAARKGGIDASGLRRAYSYGLREAGDWQGSLDQRIEVLNQYLDDRSLADEMARDAIRGQRSAQLLDYYTRASAGSPRNARLWVALARFQAWFEQPAAAAASFAKAIAIRPEEQGWHEQRADLLTRESRFEEAANEYRQLFELSFGNPEWMLKRVEMLVRAGKIREADAAAEVLATRENASRRLSSLASAFEHWNQLSVAEKFATRALERINWTSDGSDARPYVRVLSRQRRLWEGLERVGKLTAEQPVRSMLAQEAGRTVADYFTPEEKLALASQIDGRWKTMEAADRDSIVEMTASARMNDELATLLADRGINEQSEGGGEAAFRRLRPLQLSRLQYSDFGGALERRAAREQGDARINYLNQAADIYRDAGNLTAEARVRAQLPPGPRTLEVTYLRAPDQLARLSRPEAINLLIEKGDASRALIAFNLWSKSQGAQKVSGWRALLGLHLRLIDAETRTGFERLLGSFQIGERLAANSKDTVQGTAWYPLANEYAHWLSLAAQPEAAELSLVAAEQGPVTSAGLAALATDWAAEQAPVAIQAYQSSLELNPAIAANWNSLAILQAKTGDRGAANASWSQALSTIQDLPEFVAVVAAGGGDGDLAAKAEQALRRLQERHALESVEGVVAAATEAPVWFDRLLDLEATELWLWEDLARDGRLSASQRRSVYAKLLRARETAIAKANGTVREEAAEALRQLREQYVDWLLAQGEVVLAQPMLAQLVRGDAARYGAQQALAAGLQGRIAELIASWTRGASPSSEVLLPAAWQLRKKKPEQALLLEAFVYETALSQNPTDAPSALGLADVRFRQGRPEDAESILASVIKRMGLPFAYHDAVATLLGKYQRPSAQDRWRQLALAEPWNAKAASESTKDVSALKALASSNLWTYADRVSVADRFPLMGGASGLGSAELDGLAAVAMPGPDQADRPYFFPLRLRVARESKQAVDQRIRLLAAALAVQPEQRAIRVELVEAGAATRARLAYLALKDVNAHGYDYELFSPVTDEAPLYATAAQVHERLAMWPEADRWWRLTARAAADDALQKRSQDGLRRVAREQRRGALIGATMPRVGLAIEEQPGVRARAAEGSR